MIFYIEDDSKREIDDMYKSLHLDRLRLEEGGSPREKVCIYIMKGNH